MSDAPRRSRVRAAARWLVRLGAGLGWARAVVAAGFLAIALMYGCNKDMGGDPKTPRGDGVVTQLTAALARLPIERRPIVIVTGDHSEALGDHGAPFHASDLYNSQLQVPLIITGVVGQPADVHRGIERGRAGLAVPRRASRPARCRSSAGARWAGCRRSAR